MHKPTEIHVSYLTDTGHRDSWVCTELAALHLDDTVLQLGFCFASSEQAEAFAAEFPKYCKAFATKILILRNGKSTREPFVGFDFNDARCTNRTTGERNEAAEKRNAKIISVLKGLA